MGDGNKRAWRVAVLGPGGIGGLVGAVLARLGDEVTCLAPAATAAHLRERGLELRSRAKAGHLGSFRVPVRAATRLTAPVDVCFVTVKEPQLAEAVAAVPAGALGDGLIVPFLNGIDHVAWLRERYPAEQVVAGTIRVESARVAPGVIEQLSPFCAVELAARPGNRASARVEALAGRLREAGMDVMVGDDEARVLWSKLVLLAPIALLTTHAHAPAGEVRARRGEEAAAVVSEIVAAARAADGVELDEAATLRLLDRVPAGMRSSMQRDDEAGRPLELDAIGGAILRAAARGGVLAPVTTRLVEDLRARASSRRS